MKKLTNQLNKEVKMTAEEKERIYNNLAFMVMSAPENSPSFIQLIRSPFYSFQFSQTKVIALSVLTIFLFSGGITLAASGALPGDFLYPIKTDINEKVAGLIIFNTKAQVSYETDIALRRLEEAEKLGAMGKLDENTKAEIESNFNLHTDNVEGKLSTEAALDFHSKLEAHRNVLLKLAAKVGDGDEIHLNTLAAKINTELINTELSSSTKNDDSFSAEEDRNEKVKLFEKDIENNWQGVVNVHTGAEVQLKDDENSNATSTDDLDTSIDYHGYQDSEVHDNSPNENNQNKNRHTDPNIGNKLDLKLEP